MKKILFIGVLALATLSSCTTVKKTSYITEVQTAVVQYPTVTELEVMEQATATVEWGWNPFRRISLDTRKGNLVANLLKSKGADVLLEEQFVFESDGFGGGHSPLRVILQGSTVSGRRHSPTSKPCVRPTPVYTMSANPNTSDWCLGGKAPVEV